MKIAQVAPLYESVPPKLYGGTERVVSYLTEALVKMGHEVTLYASADSSTSARLRPVCERALRLDSRLLDPWADHVLMAECVCQESGRYDLIHSHLDPVIYPLLRRARTPHVTTMHGRLDFPNFQNLFHEYRELPLVSISNRQREPLPWANWQGTVYHGLPEDLYRFHERPGQYLAFIGRISPEKRVEDAILIAERAGVPLKIAAKIGKQEEEYFAARVRPLLQRRDVEFVGEIGEAEKNEFLGQALALVFPIDWPEPFGLVMIESLACGTPVIARGRGSVPEVIEPGSTGFIFEKVDEAVAAIAQLPRLSRQRCRQVFEQRFTAQRMAEDYVMLYEQLAERSFAQPARRTKLGTANSSAPKPRVLGNGAPASHVFIE